MREKRYTPQQAEDLLKRLLEFAEAERADTAQGRALFRELLDATLGDVLVGPGARREVRRWTADQICTRQRAIAIYFRIFQVTPHGFTVHTNQVRMPETSGALRVGAELREDGTVALRFDGNAADVINVQVINLLRAAGAGKLRVCECGRVFVRTRRQEFCSEQCQKRVYMRARRAAERGARHAKAPRAR